MNYYEYSKLLNEKISDADFNLKQAEKKYRETKAAYDAVLLEKYLFDKFYGGEFDEECADSIEKQEQS